MSEVGHWQVRSLNCLSEIGSGSAPLSRKGSFPIMGANGQIGWTDRSNFEGGYLVGRVGAAGAIKFVSSLCWASDNTLTLLAKPAVCDSTFLGHLLFYLHPEKLATINAQSLITQTNLGNLSAEIPLSTKEQRAIAAILDTVDESILRTEALITKLRQVKAGMLHDLLTRGLDENGELRDPFCHPEQFKDSPLGRIPKEWKIISIGDACGLLKDGTHLPPKRVSNGPLLLSVRNMIDGSLKLLPDDTKVSWNFFNQMHRNWEIHIGDVLIAIVGATLGKSARVPELPPFTLQRSVAVLRGKEEVLRNEFFARVVSTRSFQDQLWKYANQTAQPGIYLDQIASIKIAIPLTKEQTQIANYFNWVEDRTETEEIYLEKLHLIKQGLMQDLLTGKVRIPESMIKEYQANAEVQ